VALENVEEKLGGKLLPVLAKVAGGVATFLQQIDSGKGAGGAFASAVSGAFNRIKSTIQNVVKAVRGYLNAHRQDINSVIAAVRRFGRFVKDVFENIALPIVRRTFKAMGQIIGDLVHVVRGVVRFVSGLLSGNWSKAWSGAKEAVGGAGRAILTAVKTLASNLWTIIKELGPKLVKLIVKGVANLGKALATGIVDGVKAAAKAVPGMIGGVLKGIGGTIASGVTGGIGGKVAGAVKGLFSGDGAGMAIPGGSFSGSLDGARASLAPFAAVGARFGLRVTDGRRPPGTRTSSGGISYHSTGEAIDMGDGRGPDANKLAFFNFLKSHYGGRLAELIYGPGQVGIKDGRPYNFGPKLNAQHMDHVHVAFDTGAPGVGDGPGRRRPTGDGIGQIESLWQQAGGRRSAAAIAAAVAMAESSGRPGVSHRNSDGSIDRGLWQINSVHGSLSTFDRLGNARAAVRISGNGSNWSPWTTFTSGAYRRFLSAAQAALGGTGGGNSGGSSGGSRGSSHANPPRTGAGGSSTTLAHPAHPFPHILDPQNPADVFYARQHRIPIAPTKGVARDLGSSVDTSGGGSGDGADTGDPNQALIDALAAEAEAQQALTDALNSNAAELKANRDFATGLSNTSNYQLQKMLTDVISRQVIGAGVASRSFTPGDASERRY
jgi:hypothetical protein